MRPAPTGPGAQTLRRSRQSRQRLGHGNHDRAVKVTIRHHPPPFHSGLRCWTPTIPRADDRRAQLDQVKAPGSVHL